MTDKNIKNILVKPCSLSSQKYAKNDEYNNNQYVTSTDLGQQNNSFRSSSKSSQKGQRTEPKKVTTTARFSENRIVTESEQNNSRRTKSLSLAYLQRVQKAKNLQLRKNSTNKKGQPNYQVGRFSHRRSIEKIEKFRHQILIERQKQAGEILLEQLAAPCKLNRRNSVFKSRRVSSQKIKRKFSLSVPDKTELQTLKNTHRNSLVGKSSIEKAKSNNNHKSSSVINSLESSTSEYYGNNNSKRHSITNRRDSHLLKLIETTFPGQTDSCQDLAAPTDNLENRKSSLKPAKNRISINGRVPSIKRGASNSKFSVKFKKKSSHGSQKSLKSLKSVNEGQEILQNPETSQEYRRKKSSRRRKQIYSSVKSIRKSHSQSVISLNNLQNISNNRRSRISRQINKSIIKSSKNLQLSQNFKSQSIRKTRNESFFPVSLATINDDVFSTGSIANDILSYQVQRFLQPGQESSNDLERLIFWES